MIYGLKTVLPLSGRIKIGQKVKSKSGGPIPQKVDHFILTKDQRDGTALDNLIPDERAMSQLPDECYDESDRLVRLPILIWQRVDSNGEVQDSFPHSYQFYNGKKKERDCDGRRCTRFELVKNKEGFIERTGRTKTEACDREHTGRCPYYQDENNPGCKPYGQLYCLVEIGSTLGVYRWDTTSMISVEKMVSSLALVQMLPRENTGPFIPCWLVLTEVKIKKGKAWVCHLETREVTPQFRALLGNGSVIVPRQLTSEIDDEREERNVAEEFYPAEQVEEPPKQETKKQSAKDRIKAAAAKDEVFDDEPPPPTDDEAPPVSMDDFNI